MCGTSVPLVDDRGPAGFCRARCAATRLQRPAAARRAGRSAAAAPLKGAFSPAPCTGAAACRLRSDRHMHGSVALAPVGVFLSRIPIMNEQDFENINVAAFDAMPTPAILHARLPLTEAAGAAVMRGRETLRNILDRRDPRLFAVVGPCSIHDPAAGLDYARRLAALQAEVEDTLVLVMRVYFEKPRTTTGWKGYVNDPDMDDSFHVDRGMENARRFLLDVAGLGLPAATEALDPISPQYLGDLISWTAIGARTAESQTHREMSSGLSTPVGFKNGTDGDIDIAINAILSSSQPHSFLGINAEGRVAIVRTRGNRHAHVVLRGGNGRPNYDTVSVKMAEQALAKAGLAANIVVDCSHANSYKDPSLQPLVMADVVNQIRFGNRSLVGVMIESNLVAGKQAIPADLSKLVYGCSVTDGCVGWETTEEMIREAGQLLRPVIAGRSAQTVAQQA
jgi:3-deoxy-7-phosphoheptulonate synthase